MFFIGKPILNNIVETFEKSIPVGTINKYGKTKMPDGSWQYVKKGQGAKPEPVPEGKPEITPEPTPEENPSKITDTSQVFPNGKVSQKTHADLNRFFLKRMDVKRLDDIWLDRRKDLWKDAPVETVSIKNIWPSQERLDESKVNFYRKNRDAAADGGEEVLGIRIPNSKNIVLFDGHHRVAADILEGKKETNMKLVSTFGLFDHLAFREGKEPTPPPAPPVPPEKGIYFNKKAEDYVISEVKRAALTGKSWDKAIDYAKFRFPFLTGVRRDRYGNMSGENESKFWHLRIYFVLQALTQLRAEGKEVKPPEWFKEDEALLQWSEEAIEKRKQKEGEKQTNTQKLIDILKKETEPLRAEYIRLTKKFAKESYDRAEVRGKWSDAQWYDHFGIKWKNTTMRAYKPGTKEVVEIEVPRPIVGDDMYARKEVNRKLKYMEQARKEVTTLLSMGYDRYEAMEVEDAEQHYKNSVIKLAHRINEKKLDADNLTTKSGRVGVNIETVLTDGKQTVRAWTIIAEGPIQRPHYRYLIK